VENVPVNRTGTASLGVVVTDPAGNPLQRLVSKATSAETTVTATLGSSSQSLNVWVIWSTISCHNGVITQSLDFNSLPDKSVGSLPSGIFIHRSKR